MYRPTYCEINLSALKHNFHVIRNLAPHSKILAMIKANAYGHGAVHVAKTLSNADGFGVCCLEEALVLREHNIQQRIVLMEGFFTAAELPLIEQHQLDIVIHNYEQLSMLIQYRLNVPIHVWIKIDTGMHRLGFPIEEIMAVWQALQNNNLIKIECLMTHFADGDDVNKPTTEHQLKLFNTITIELNISHSMAHSGGILGWPEAHRAWIRPGIMLYGISPFNDKTGSEHGLKPVMTFHSKIVAVNNFKTGDAIGYGGTWVCPHPMKVGVVAVGYGDGYPRQINSGTPILINNQLTQVIGRVSMDMLTVDLHTQPEAKVGDSVVLWGSDSLPLELVARHSNLSPYEILCKITQRVPYRYRM